MNILFIITGLGLGGAEKQLVALANKMYESGHKITIVSLTGEAITKPISDIKIYNIGMSKNPFSFFSALVQVRSIIKNLAPDIVHSHMFHANIFSRILRKITNIPVLVSTAHNSYEGGWLRMFLYRITDHIPSISTNVSIEAVNAFISQKATRPGRMICIYNGIDTDKFKFSKNDRVNYRNELNIQEDTHIILCVGRLTKAKDYPNLFDAYKYILENIELKKNLTILIAGSGELEESLTKYAIKLGIIDNVIFLGPRDDIEKLMNITDLFVLPSEWEGFGLVVAEAMSCERLVVATDSGGIREVIGDCGYIVPPKNSELLANGIIKYLQLPKNEKENIGQKSRSRIIEFYSLDTAVNKWLELYLELKNT